MPVWGRTHVLFIAALGVVIVAIFVAAARLTRASRRQVLGALAGAAAAGAINLALDVAAHAAGFWRYPEASTSFGPLLYYVEAGLGFGAIALALLWSWRRFGWRGPAVGFGVFAVYGPVRDRVTAASTHLIEFNYSPPIVVVLADSLFEYVLPMLGAYAVLVLVDRSSSADGGGTRRSRRGTATRAPTREGPEATRRYCRARRKQPH
jgi:hypothetical protein